MFLLIRIIIAVLIFGVVLFLLRKQLHNHWMFGILIASLCILIVFIQLMVIPIEYYFTGFDSPEDAFTYTHGKGYLITEIVETDNCAFILYRDKNGEGTYRATVDKKDEKWKMEPLGYNKKDGFKYYQLQDGGGFACYIKNIHSKEALIDVSKHPNVLYYLRDVYATDTLGSSFVEFKNDELEPLIYTVISYAEIDSYSVVVDGVIVPLW